MANSTSWKRDYYPLKLLWKSKCWVILKVQLAKNGLEKMWYKCSSFYCKVARHSCLHRILQWSSFYCKVERHSCLHRILQCCSLLHQFSKSKLSRKAVKCKKKTVVVRCKLNSLLLQFFSIYHQNGHMSPVGVSFHTGAGVLISTNEQQSASATLLWEVC